MTIDRSQAIADRLAGKTLKTIADEQGVTIPAVNKVLQESGGPTYMQARIAQAEPRRQMLEELSGRISETLDKRGPMTSSEMAQELGVSKADVGSAWPEHLTSIRAHKHGGEPKQTHTDAEVLEALRTAARYYPGPLTAAGYSSARATSNPSWPSQALITNRFGSWAEACARAGISSGKRSAKAGPVPTPDGELLAVVRQFLQESERGSIVAYERWRKSRPGAPSVPSIRIRFGGWNRAKELAVADASQAHG